MITVKIAQVGSINLSFTKNQPRLAIFSAINVTLTDIIRQIVGYFIAAGRNLLLILRA